jgi:mono/diheme cytochrome c family protein
MTRTTAALLATLSLAACATADPSDEPVGGPGDSQRGRVMAEVHCSGCHAIGYGTKSPYDGAPTFPEIVAKGHLEDYAEAFAEGIMVPHNGRVVMPEFVLNPREIEDLFAYMKTLRK